MARSLPVSFNDSSQERNATRAIYAPHLAGAGGVRGAIGWYRAVFETAQHIRRIGETKLTLPVLGINGEFGAPEVGNQMTAVATDVTSAARRS